ncbi:type I restriction enzyme S subunit [Albidovulum inexpectatum]|uniref:Type I restriction enzyme S subunit n=1 Tax=Albidovulum inexpectatum TaxID=196587 RepID=A0A2S5JD29_9RHOB|nr:restriction endonuclease subunit S [Albidovulum inexpectatum]PPB79404.1 type I restriction enzyme S subunit [Albidovulum inexpectatum]
MSIAATLEETRVYPPLPPEWPIVRLRHAFNFNKGLTITKENLQDDGIPCVNYGEIHSKYGFEVDPDQHPLKCVDVSYLKGNQSSLLRRGDFVFADTSEDIEGSGNFTHYNSDRQAFAGYHTLIARPKVEMNTRFMAYLFDSASFRAQVRSAVKGVKVFSISQAVLKPTFIWLPPKAEQRAISRFLDGACARVDEAVRIRQAQIALLRERRQILIQTAVTRGLTPDAPMKDSGIDWIGQIPAHWEVRRNFALFREMKVPGQPDLPVLSVSIHSGVSNEELSEEENIRSVVKIEDRTSYKEVKPGDIAYNMMRAWQGGIGAVSVHGMVSPAYVVARPNPELAANYFELLYRCPAFIRQMDAGSKGITDFRKRLYWDDFKNLVTLVPPFDEQVEIIEHVAETSKRIEAAISLKEQQIAALREFKASLIDAAVTGKIRVTEPAAGRAGARPDTVLSAQA